MTKLTDEQQLAVDSIDKHVIVSAGAGSGKTSVLVSRYLRVLASNPEASVTNLVAVTFTRKAADEMRSRLKSELKRLSTAGAAEEQGRWLDLLSRIDQARIGTIHSLCESILRSFPAEALMDPQFEVLSELERAELIDQTIDEQVREALMRSDEHMLKLFEYTVPEVKKWLRELVGRATTYRAARAVCQMEGLFESLWVQAATTAFSTFMADNQITQAIRLLGEFPVSGKFEANRVQSLDLCRTLLQPVRQDRLRLDLLERLSVADGFAEISFRGTRNASDDEKIVMTKVNLIKDALKKLRKEIPPAPNAADAAAELCQRALIELADRAIEQFEKLKNHNQKVDFDDLIDRTHALLSNDKKVSQARKHYNATIHAILVDEFQDTNKRQAELLSRLVGENARLFLIGDDKQSIYRFQGAEVKTFNDWKDRLGGDSNCGLLLSLTRSFRSHPSIVCFVNTIFEKHFASASQPARFEARHQSLVASRTEPGHQNVEVLLSVNEKDSDSKLSSAQSKELESQAVAAWILDKVTGGAPVLDKELRIERPIQFADFAVLVQNNSDFAPIEMALADAGIPYVTMSGSGYLSRQEIFDLENLLRFLAAPDDSHALLGVLRSPMFGVPDDVIQALHTPLRPLWPAVRRAGLSDDCPYPGVGRAVTILRDLMLSAAQMPLADLVRYAIRKTQFDLILSALPNGKQRSRNIWKFVALTVQMPGLSLRDFLTTLESMRKLNVKTGDAPLAADNAVQLMTIHKSKGLEFGAVALPALARRFHKYDLKIIHSEEYGICLDARALDEAEKPALFTLAHTIERQMEAAEKKRLFYVAMTRARDYLGLFVAVQAAQKSASFRSLLVETLNLSDETEGGARHLAGTAGGAHYLLRRLTTSDLASWKTDLEAARGDQDSCFEAPNSVSFSLLAPLADEPDQRQFSVAFQQLLRVTPDAQPLHATTIGTFFHTAMEHLPFDLALPSSEQLHQLAARGETAGVVHPMRISELVVETEQMLRLLLNSRLYLLMSGARERLYEVPYLAVREGTVVERRPDLILQDAHGAWHIIDFKTDHIEELEIEKHNRAHAEQINEYVADLEALVKSQVQGWVYYAHHGQLAAIQRPFPFSLVDVAPTQPR
jgi:ATP-dependent helicase/nuclease subunit A